MKLADHYEAVGLLAEGGMASVFLAVHRGTGGSRVAALKVVRGTMAQDSEYQEMFASEAELALRLNHPNVIHSYEAGGEGSGRYLAMEFLSGHSLATLLGRVRKTIELDLHVHVLCEVLRALHYVHRLTDYDGECLGLVHRDVSPANIFITYDGTVKLVDFGIAKNHRSSVGTMAGVVKGKAAYMAPEQAATATVDGRADIFSVGVLLWEALTRTRLVDPKADASESLVRRVSGLEPRVTELVPDAEAKLVEVCERAMRILPSERYATALEMLEELEQWASTRPAVIGPRPLSKEITAAFAAEKQRVEAKIRAAMTGVRPSGSSVPPLSLDVRTSTDDSTSDGTGLPGSRPRHGSQRNVVILVAFAVLVSAGIALAGLAVHRSATQPSTVAASSTPRLGAPPSALPAPEPTSVASATPAVTAESSSGIAKSSISRDRPPRPAPPPPRSTTSEETPRKPSHPLRTIDKEDPYE